MMTTEDRSPDPVLCYVSGDWAYFTTQPLEKQWGDHWDNRPYEHNAGLPYQPYKQDEHWEIVKIAFDGPFVTPDEGTLNSSYCVRDINSGAVAWLHDRWGDSGISIHAGTPLSQFKDLMRKAHGHVYVEEK